MSKIKRIIIGVLVIVIVFPTLATAGSFTVSLIHGKSIPDAVQILGKQIDFLVNRVSILENKTDKEESCRKAAELKIASQETKVAYYTETGNKPMYASFAPDTTKELLEYLYGYKQNYENTNSRYYLHNPDYAPELVQKYIPILEDRWQKYLVQKKLCEGLDFEEESIIMPQIINVSETEDIVQEERQEVVTVGNFIITNDAICYENGKPIIYFFGVRSCPHSQWEYSIIQKVVKEFNGYISFHDNMESENDPEIFSKYSPAGYVPAILIGCKYLRASSGENQGEELEKTNLTSLICNLTGGQPQGNCNGI